MVAVIMNSGSTIRDLSQAGALKVKMAVELTWLCKSQTRHTGNNLQKKTNVT
jgi:hypothetical protein